MGKKKISDIERGSGFFQGFVTGLMDVVREQGVPFEAVYRLVTPEGRPTLEKMVAVVREDWVSLQGDPEPPPVPEPTITDVPVTVYYSRMLDAMIVAGAYDYVNPDVTVDNFPIEGGGKQDIDAVLVHFDRTMSDDAIDAELERLGLRDGKIEELLALGEQNPDLQRQFPIVARGSVWRHPDGDRGVAFLGGSDRKRDLDLGWVEGDWFGYYRFLAVRNK